MCKEIVFTITTKATHRGKEYDRPTLEVIVKGDKMYAKTLGSDSISATIDVTPLWNMFKEIMNYDKELQDNK